MTDFPRRGEVWLTELPTSTGSVLSGTRPAVVVQNDLGNQLSNTTVVVPVTSKFERIYRFMAVVQPPEGGLTEPSVANASAIMAIDRSRLLRRMGQLSPQRMADVERAVKANLALD